MATAARNNKGAARWLSEGKCGVVTKAVGKYINTMGYRDDGQRLFVEEVVFLVDCDELDLVKSTTENVSDDATMSKVEVFTLLEQGGINMSVYTVYAVLREQRYHVYRHNAWRTPAKEWKNLQMPLLISQLRVSENHEGKRQKFEAPETLPIAFDAYLPQASFSKNKMRKPDFCVSILGADELMPPVEVLQATAANLPSGVPLRLGIVGDSSITFIDVSEFDFNTHSEVQEPAEMTALQPDEGAEAS